jgi:hypothetical protein
MQLPEEKTIILDNPLKLDIKIRRPHIQNSPPVGDGNCTVSGEEADLPRPQEKKRIEIPIVHRRLLLQKNRLAGAWDILDLNGGWERWRRGDRSNGVCSDIKGAKGLGFTVGRLPNHGSVL